MQRWELRAWKWGGALALVGLALGATWLVYGLWGVDLRFTLTFLGVTLAALWFGGNPAMAGALLVVAGELARIPLGGGSLQPSDGVRLGAFLLVSWTLAALVAAMRERGRLPRLVDFSLEQRHGERALAALAGPILWLRPICGAGGEICGFQVRRACQSPEPSAARQGPSVREGQTLDEIIPHAREVGCFSALVTALQTRQPIIFELTMMHGGHAGVYELHAVPEDGELVVGWRDLTAERRIQRQLRLGEWRYRSLVEATSAIVWTTPASGEFEQEQPEWSAFTGQSASEQKGWGWLKAVHPDDREVTAREWSLAVARQSLYTVEHRLRDRDGEYHYMSARAVPILDDQGELIEWVGVHTDVTARRQMEEQVAQRELFYHQLIEGLPHFTWTCDAAGRFDYMSQRWHDYSGSDSREPMSEGSPSHVHPEDQERLRQAWQEASSSGGNFNVAIRLRRHDGVYRWFDSYASPFRDAQGGIVKWLGCSLDIDDRKRAEDALRRSEVRLRNVNYSLEQRVRERTAELETRSEQLRSVALDLAETESRERKRLARLLHDHFQQLISAAKLKVGMVRRRAGDSAAGALREIESLLEEAIEASRSLATELSPPVLHDGGLVPALEWLARRMEHDHGLVVSFGVEGACEPDNEQVRVVVFECVRELLFNVTKHAATHAAALKIDMLREGLLHVQVCDQGRGFDAVQEEARKRLGGSFGLFSIRERLSLVGGLMHITSSPGKGTCVDLTVPSVVRREAAPAAALPAEPAVPDRAPLAHLRVVVADDHRLYREGLVAVLVQEPFLEVVAQAADGQEAVDLCRGLKPDVLIVDISMPRLNGVQVTGILARQFPQMQIIGLSMHQQDDMAQAMRAAGAAAYFSKDENAEDTLLATLRSVAAARLPKTSPEPVA